MSGSPPAWRALSVLKEKQLSFESKLLDASKGELKSEEVLALNPRGQVPTFKDGDVVVNESLAIMQYLEEAYPEVRMLPEDIAQRAVVYQRLHEAVAMFTVFQPIFYQAMINKVNTPEEKEKFNAGLDKLRKELGYFESYLGAAKDGDALFIAADMFSLADVCLATNLFMIVRGGGALDKFPLLTKYTAAMKERPCFAETWPPHWKTSEDKTWLKDL